MKKIISIMALVMSMTGCSLFSQSSDVMGNGDSNVVDTVYFDFDSSALRTDAVATLDSMAQTLVKEDGELIVQGHTDERGTREYNLALGERRANAVAVYLESKGVDAKRITTVSYGKERPAVQGNTEEAYAKNRRSIVLRVVEVK